MLFWYWAASWFLQYLRYIECEKYNWDSYQKRVLKSGKLSIFHKMIKFCNSTKRKFTLRLMLTSRIRRFRRLFFYLLPLFAFLSSHASFSAQNGCNGIYVWASFLWPYISFLTSVQKYYQYVLFSVNNLAI